MSLIANAVLVVNLLLMLVFAAVQWNDPDPLLWIGFYLLCAAVPLLVLLRKPVTYLVLVAVIGCVIELTGTASGAYNYFLHMNEEPLMQSMNPNKPYIEEAREFLGSLIALGLVLVSAWLGKVKHGAAA